MIKPVYLTVGIVLTVAGLIGIYFWGDGNLSPDDGIGLHFSVIGATAGIYFVLLGFGLNLLRGHNSGSSGGAWSDGDGDCGD
jgi:hypothetical protein